MSLQHASKLLLIANIGLTSARRVQACCAGSARYCLVAVSRVACEQGSLRRQSLLQSDPAQFRMYIGAAYMYIAVDIISLRLMLTPQ